ncbi:MAG: YhjD/YihY/BrkB family envelope integrity protein, partial [Pseudomonadota bacterium]
MANSARKRRRANTRDWDPARPGAGGDAREAEPSVTDEDLAASAAASTGSLEDGPANENTELPPTFFEQAYETTRPKTLLSAIYRTYEHSGFTMAGSVAFSFVLALFPFCIFVGAVAGVFGGRELAEVAITKLFEVLPAQVAQALVPQVNAIM